MVNICIKSGSIGVRVMERAFNRELECLEKELDEMRLEAKELEDEIRLCQDPLEKVNLEKADCLNSLHIETYTREMQAIKNVIRQIS